MNPLRCEICFKEWHEIVLNGCLFRRVVRTATPGVDCHKHIADGFHFISNEDEEVDDVE